MFAFGASRARRRPGLTPMIDVVFLLLVFFMLAARFGQDAALPLHLAAGGGAAWQGPPRLITLRGDGVALNGSDMPREALIAALPGLMTTPGDPVLLRAVGGATTQALIDLIEAMQDAGLPAPLLVE